VFDNLTGRLNSIFKELRRQSKLSQGDIDSTLREVRLALLEADVHYGVVKDFVEKVRARAEGHEVSKALNPAQQMIKIVHEELIGTLGTPEALQLKGGKPRILLLVGLQGSGKTTTAAKIANKLKGEGERVLLAAADPYRPAAVEQLQILGERLKIDVFADEKLTAVELVSKARQTAEKGGYSVMLIDSAGRSQLDDEMMAELAIIHREHQPVETLLVADAMTGQEAVNIAQGFRKELPLTGMVLTKMDGDARGGAAISIRSVTGLPIKLLGTGEGMDGLETFDPSRLASRILGMGDVVGLIEKAETSLDQEEAEEQAKKMLSGDFTFEDFAAQLRQVRQMGPIGQLMDMLPNAMGGGQMAQMASPAEAEKNLSRVEAMINSMTPEERKKPKLLNGSRKRRIASGSGTQVQDVNRLVKQHREMQKLFKRLNKTGMGQLSKMFR